MPRTRPDDYEDDDDRDDRPRRRRPPPTDSGSGTVIKVLAIIGAVLVAVLLVCGGLVAFAIYGAKSGMESMMKQVDKQMEEARVQQERQAAQGMNPVLNDRDESKRVAEAFVRDIREGRLANAYQSTTAAYQARVPRKDFDKFVADNPALKWPLPTFEPNFNQAVNGTRYEQRFKAAEPGRFLDYSLTMLREGPVWKVDEFKQN